MMVNNSLLSSRAAQQTGLPVVLGQEMGETADAHTPAATVAAFEQEEKSVLDACTMTDVLLQVVLGQSSPGSLLSRLPTEILVSPKALPLIRRQCSLPMNNIAPFPDT